MAACPICDAECVTGVARYCSDECRAERNRRAQLAETLPFHPLWDYVVAKLDLTAEIHVTDGLSAVDVATYLGIKSRSQVSRWRQIDRISSWAADKYATRLGMHPADLWGDDYWSLPSNRELPPRELAA